MTLWGPFSFKPQAASLIPFSSFSFFFNKVSLNRSIGLELMHTNHGLTEICLPWSLKYGNKIVCYHADLHYLSLKSGAPLGIFSNPAIKPRTSCTPGRYPVTELRLQSRQLTLFFCLNSCGPFLANLSSCTDYQPELSPPLDEPRSQGHRGKGKGTFQSLSGIRCQAGSMATRKSCSCPVLGFNGFMDIRITSEVFEG